MTGLVVCSTSEKQLLGIGPVDVPRAMGSRSAWWPP